MCLFLPCPGPSAAGQELPVFMLNSTRARDIRVSEIPLYGPPPSPPKNTGRQPGVTAARGLPPAPEERYPLYRPYRQGFVKMPGGLLRTRLGAGGEQGTDNIRFTGSTRLTVDGENGRAEIRFPAALFEDPLPGDEVLFYIKTSTESSRPELSWAAVLCSGDGYLGYKGYSLKLPEAAGDFSMSETLALGGRKLILGETHPWLIPARRGLYGPPAQLNRRESAYLCSGDFRRRMRDFTVRALPRQLDRFHLAYNSRDNSLQITWESGGEK